MKILKALCEHIIFPFLIKNENKKTFYIMNVAGYDKNEYFQQDWNQQPY